MIHELFSGMTDRQSAKTYSEIFTDGYRFIQDEEAMARYGRGLAMLTNPSIKLLTAHARYLEVSAEGKLDRPLMFTVAARAILPPPEQIITVYNNSVSQLQEAGDIPHVASVCSALLDGHEDTWPATPINDWISEQVAKRGRSLLSAHFVGRVTGNNDMLVSTIAYPGHIRQDLHAAIQDNVDPAMLSHPDLQNIARELSPDDQQIQALLGNICASKLLYTPETFREHAGPYLQRLADAQNS